MTKTIPQYPFSEINKILADSAHFQNLASMSFFASIGLIMLSGVLNIADSLHQQQIAQRRRLNQCIECGYDLRATKDRCPECGTAIVANQP